MMTMKVAEFLHHIFFCTCERRTIMIRENEGVILDPSSPTLFFFGKIDRVRYVISYVNATPFLLFREICYARHPPSVDVQ